MFFVLLYISGEFGDLTSVVRVLRLLPNETYGRRGHTSLAMLDVRTVVHIRYIGLFLGLLEQRRIIGLLEQRRIIGQ